MKKTITILSCLAFILPITMQIALAGDIGDLRITPDSVKFSTDYFLEGRAIRIYATVANTSDKDLLGVVRFSDNDNQIGGDQAISVYAGSTDGVFIDWAPGNGSHTMKVQIIPWNTETDDPTNNVITKSIFVIQDTDRDGIPNDQDEDDDNDGFLDTEDLYPLDPNEHIDSDGDGIGDTADTDDDNDGVPDEFDDLPTDPEETLDTDGDGIGNIADEDDDGDGISDNDEENQNTNPLSNDSDSDSVDDKNDPFPLDPNEWIDTDGDNIGNNTDTDDDNDGFIDEEDEFPLNKGPVIQLSQEDFTAGYLEEYTLDASGSYDEDGEIVTYLWNIDGETFEGNSITHRFKRLGEHDVKLTVIDNNGESRTIDLQASVVNVRLYRQLGISLAAIFLALVIFFKYIAGAKNPQNTKKSK